VQHFNGCAELFNAFRQISLAADHPGGFHDENRAQPLAAGEGAVPHRFVDGRGNLRFGWQEAFQGCVGKLLTGEEHVFYFGLHSLHDN
jgi:hypothetical protein